MATVAVDTAYLASYATIPEPTIQALIDSPTTDLVTSFLTTIISKAQEHERTKADRLRLEIELENAVRGNETRARSLKSTADQALQEVDELRKKLASEETARASLEAQLQNAHSSSSDTTAEVESLRSQVARLEKSNRDTLALLDSKSTAHDKLAEDLANQHQKSLDLRREISSLEERRQSAENTVSHAKFRESSLVSEVESLKRNNDWLDTELKTKTAEFTKHKKDKSSRISELQRLNDEVTSNLETSKRLEASLRKRLEEVSQKADDSFAKIQQLQEEMSRSEESSRMEADNIRRLADLQQRSAETARRRVEEVEASLEQIKDDAAEELGQMQTELESEREGKEAAELRVDMLEAQLEQSKNTSHLRAPSGGFSTPIRAGSPTAHTPNSTRSRGALSMTQMYADYNNVKVQLDAEKRRSEKLTSTLDEMLQELEKKGPEMQELQMEHSRLQAEVDQLSELLAEANQDKEMTRKEAKRSQSRLDGLSREAELNRQQLRDLSAQIKVLLVEIQLHRESVELTPADRAQLQQAAHGDEASLDGLSDTARFISQRLITFKDVFDLQEKNAELTRLTRELGERMESEEARRQDNQEQQQRLELEELQERIDRYKDEIKSLVTQSESYVRERDMFRRMLAHRGTLPPGADQAAMFGSSINGPAAPMTPRNGTPGPNVDQSPSSRELGDYAKLLKELQSHFDAYRKEASTDHATLKAQADRLAKEKSQLQGDIARASSQLTLAQERHDMLQANYAMLQTESNELQKRSNTLAESAAKQDLRTQQVAEELVESKSLTESLRNENANLKAEKSFWGQTETRLTEDNHMLREESSRLNRIITDAQNLSNEQRLTEGETRRKLQAQVETLEVDLRTSQRKLDDELETSRNANLRREYDQEQNRNRIDDLMKSLGNAREELATVKSTKDQLQARVEELKIELRNAEERSRALQPKPTPRSETQPQPETVAESGVDLEREQELNLEIAELHRELDLAKAELENAKVQIDTYKAISQTTEEALQSQTEAYDQYKDDTDKTSAEKDQKIRDLEQRVEDISSELADTNSQLSELRSSAEDTNQRLEQQRGLFEDEMSRLRDESERYKETANFYQQDLKAQAEIAKQAQRNYEEELVKHADAAKTLQSVRNEYHDVRLEVSQAKADAEAARTTLSQNEESWINTREQYDKELTELKTRHSDIDAQNKLLHKQLETVSAQIAALQQDRAQASESIETVQALADSSTQNLHEVIKYLRREKEIVDVQYELSVQEARRLRQQLEYTQTQLGESRLRIEQERQRQSEKEKGSISHNKLMDTLNELNVFRESSVTLRNEARQAQTQLAEKSKRVEELTLQIQPLQTTIRELENERDLKSGEYKLLEEDRNRWQQRTQTILQKYDRIDPAELEGLKEQIKKLEEERSTVLAERTALQQQVDGFSQTLEAAKEEVVQPLRDQRTKMIEQFKARSKELSSKINTGKAEMEELAKQLNDTKAELEVTKQARDEAVARADKSDSTAQGVIQKQDVAMQDTGEEGQVFENASTESNVDLNVLRLRAEAAETGAASAVAEVATLQSRVFELEQTVQSLSQQLQDAQTELQQSREQAQAVSSAGSNATLEKAKEDLAAAQVELETLRLQVANGNAPAATEVVSAEPTKAENMSEETTISLPPESEQVAAQVAKIRAELEEAHSKRIGELEQQYHQRAEQMKRQLSTKLTEGKNTIREQLNDQHAQTLAALKQEHETAMSEVIKNHQAQMENLKQTLATGTGLGNGSGSDAAGAVPPQTPSKSTAAPETATLTESSTAPPMTPQQVRSLIQSNSTARDIISRNIRTKLEQETTKIKEESEKTLTERLEDARQKAEKAKEQAVNMEGKKWTVKFSMADNKARTLTAKMEFIQKAASDTPQRPVIEVWTIAKDIKAPPAAPPTQSPSGTAAPSLPAPAASNTTSGSPQAPPATPIQAGGPIEGQQAQQPKQQHVPVPVQPQQQLQQQPNGQPSVNANGPPQMTTGLSLDNTSAPPLSQQPQADNATPQQANGPSSGGRSMSQQSNRAPDTTIPPKPPVGQPMGTGPGALRGVLNQGSAIPRGGMSVRGQGRGGARGGSMDASQQQTQQQPQRGGANTGGIPRGSMRGRGRGGAPGIAQPNVTTGAPGQQQQQQGGGLNVGAKQFVPGNKRPRQDTDPGNAGKRIRGGAGGG